MPSQRLPRNGHPESVRLQFRDLLLAFGVAAVLALVVWLAMPSRYRCAAVFTARSRPTQINRRLMETELIENLRHVLERQTVDQSELEPMRSAWTDDSTLSISVTTAHPQRDVSLLTEAAQNFVASLRQQAEAARRTPTNTEQVLADQATLLQRDLADAHVQVQAAMNALPEVDARSVQGTLMSQWNHIRSEFKAKRSELTDAATSLARLRAAAAPSNGMVSAAQRNEALQADAALQNDLGELAVTLNELKLYMLNVGVQTTPILNALAIAADTMKSTTAAALQSEAPAELARALAQLNDDCRRYNESFNAFSQLWRETFDRTRAQEVDPVTASLLTAFRELTERLNGFLFSAAGPLTAMRRSVNALGQLGSDSARYHLLESNLARAFHRLQTAHHRFEFAAGVLEGTDDFRLDAARRSAFGLHRRTQARIHKIDERLEREAVQSARQIHQRALTAAEAMVRRVRGVTDQTVDQLVHLQERINTTTEDAASFQDALRILEVATGKMEVVREHLNETQAHLTRLQDVRFNAKTDPDLRLARCAVADGALNRMERIRASSVTFGISALTILLGQWWATRKRATG